MLCKEEWFGNCMEHGPVYRYTLDNGTIAMAVLTYGGAIAALEVPDRQGRRVDVVLGYESLSAYLAQNVHMGALVGRHANRIAGGRFSCGGKQYQLCKNDGGNHIHGGEKGFGKRIWHAKEHAEGLCLTLKSPHMEEGYPGNLDVQVNYILRDASLFVHYWAKSDRETILNLTNHAYFNLGGHASGSIRGHHLRLWAKQYTPVGGKQCIPTGEIATVTNTPMDFQEYRQIGARIDDAFDQLQFGAGYDHNWVVDGAMGMLRPAAQAYCPATGIAMRVETTSPGIQFYTANYLDGGPLGKGGTVYRSRDAFCLETQFYPDSPNHAAFPQPTLYPGTIWEHTTVFRFATQSDFPD